MSYTQADVLKLVERLYVLSSPQYRVGIEQDISIQVMEWLTAYESQAVQLGDPTTQLSLLFRLGVFAGMVVKKPSLLDNEIIQARLAVIERDIEAQEATYVDSFFDSKAFVTNTEGTYFVSYKLHTQPNVHSNDLAHDLSKLTK